MSKTIIVGGFGVGISNAVAERFGKEGFSVALAARNAERVAAGAKALEAKGIKAAGFAADLGDAAAVRKLVADAREKLGPIAAIEWTAYGGSAGDLLKADQAAIRAEFDVAVTGLVTAVQAAHADLKSQKGAVLITNGGFAFNDPKVDEMAILYGSMGLCLANAAKHRLAGLLATRLKRDDIYVGEVIVMGIVKGTAWDKGSGTLEPSAIAEKFWGMYTARSEPTAQIG